MDDMQEFFMEYISQLKEGQMREHEAKVAKILMYGIQELGIEMKFEIDDNKVEKLILTNTANGKTFSGMIKVSADGKE